MPNIYSPDGESHTFTVTYTGLNNKSSYEFGFANSNQINGTPISSILPSSIDEVKSSKTL